MKLAPRESGLTLMNLPKADPQARAAEDQPSLPSFDEIFEKHWDWVYRVLLRMLGDPAEAEDLALEAFYRLYRRRPSAVLQFNIGGWLYRVATNFGLQSIRSFRRRGRYELTAGKEALDSAPEDRPAEIAAQAAEHPTARIA